MTLPRILSHQGLRVRIEALLKAQHVLGSKPGTLPQRAEIARAIAALHAANPSTHTEATELWAAEYLRGLG